MSATAKRILITRSEPGASETAARLSVLGYAPIVEPLFEIEPVPTDLPDFDALAFTSANGVRAFAKLSLRRDTRVFCVGGRTAEAAREAGFTQIKSADGDVVALASVIATTLGPNARLLHSGNAESRGDLAGALTSQGFSAVHVTTFRAAPASRPGPTLAALISGQPACDAVLLHSPRATAILAGFLSSRLSLKAAAISANAAEPVRDFIPAIAIAEAPTEDALLRALASLFS